ncbi:MAG: cytochrome c [Thiolinea sp.]
MMQPVGKLPAASLAMTVLLSCLCLYAGNSSANTLSPEQRQRAEQLTQSCATCHGADGIATLDIAPNLAGQKSMYLVIQIKNYRSGDRKNEMMNITVKDLSDEDVDLLAEYYSQMPAGGSDSAASDDACPE